MNLPKPTTTLLPHARAGVCILVIVTYALTLAACGNGGGQSVFSTAEGSGTPAYDGPVGDNGEFQFTPAAPGAYPGAYVVAESAGGELRTSGVEVLLTEYDAPVRVERALNGPENLPFGIPEPETFEAPTYQAPSIELELERPLPARDEEPADRAARVMEGQADLLMSAAQGPFPKIECEGRTPGRAYDTIGLFGGYTFWIGASYGYEEFGATVDFVWAYHLAPEGRYISLQSAVGAGVPPNIAGVSISTGLGMLSPPPGEDRNGEIPGGVLEGVAVSLSVSVNWLSYGFSIFLQSGGIPHRGLQLDVGVGGGISNLTLPLLLDTIGLSVGNATFTTRDSADQAAFIFVGGWTQRCGPSNKDLRTTGQAQLSQSEAISELLALVESSAALEADDFESLTRIEGSRAMLPMVSSLANAGGSGPAEGIGASTNGAWINEFLNSDPDGVCQTCANTTIDGLLADTLLRLQIAGENIAELGQATAESMNQLVGAWPSPSQQRDLSTRAIGAVDLGFAQAFENAADLRGDANRYVDRSVVVIEAQAGTPFEFRIPAEEIADLLDGYEVEDILGATVCVVSDFSGPRLEDQCGELSADGLGGAMTLTETTRIIIAATVDLSTAAGDFPDDVDTWTVRPALRLITTRSGPAEALELVAPASIYSGAPVTLTATLTDASGNISDESATFTFYDPFGEVIETVSTDTGYASIQFTPEPLSPSVDTFEATTVTVGEAEVAGYGITGTALSRAAAVRINGESIERYGLQLARVSSEEIALIPAQAAAETEEPILEVPSGRVTLEYVNPGGLSTGPLDFDL